MQVQKTLGGHIARLIASMIRFTIPVPPAQVLDRLNAFSHEWRESKMPPELRRRGFTGARATIDGAAFTLSMQPADLRNGAFVVRGAVTAEDSGSVLTAEVEETKWSKRLGWGWVLLLAIFVVVIAGWQTGDAGYAVLSTAALLFGRVLILEGLRSRAEARFRLVLERAVQVSVPQAT